LRSVYLLPMWVTKWVTKPYRMVKSCGS
jgi:hypothetical protein